MLIWIFLFHRSVQNFRATSILYYRLISTLSNYKQIHNESPSVHKASDNDCASKKEAQENATGSTWTPVQNMLLGAYCIPYYILHLILEMDISDIFSHLYEMLIIYLCDFDHGYIPC